MSHNFKQNQKFVFKGLTKKCQQKKNMSLQHFLDKSQLLGNKYFPPETNNSFTQSF